MSFRILSFSSLFHEAFHIDPQNFIEHLMLDNEIRPFAERAVFKMLLCKNFMDALPPVSTKESAAVWERMRYRLGYIEGGAEDFLSGIDVSKTDLSRAINTDLRFEKFIDQFIGSILNDEIIREAVLWELLLDLSLRERVIKATGKEYLASTYDITEPDQEMRAAVREHLMLKHDKTPWTSLVDKLVQQWGMKSGRIDRLVDILVKAHRTAKIGNSDVEPA